MKVFAVLAAFATAPVLTQAGLSIDSPACTTFDKDDVITDPSKCPTGKQLAAPACEDLEAGDRSYCYTMNEALFGYPKYGGEVTGELYYNYLGNQSTACTPIPVVPGLGEGGKDAILVVDRGGGCTFVQKVRNGEIAGFQAVIVVDNKDTGKRVFMKDDGTGKGIGIPSVFVKYDQGKHIKEGIKTYGDGFVRTSLRWTVPEVDGNVQWSLWTSADDEGARHFKEDFQLVFDRIGSEQDFTPHFFIIDGTKHCLINQGVNLCGRQCIYGGQYCAEDPERDLQRGIDGADVVYENLRQMCIFKASQSGNAAEKNSGQIKFFDYMDYFAKYCKDKDETHSRPCSEKQMLKAKFTQKDIDVVRTCAGTCTTDECDKEGEIRPADDYIEPVSKKRKNQLLEDELKAQRFDNVFTLPTVIINGRHYRGGFSCSHPPSTGSCGVLNAVCEAYKDGKEPLACNSNYCWNDENCPGNCRGLVDCKGVCNGMTKHDVCNVCGGDGKSCQDTACNPDCNGKCGGSATEDSCGVCGGDGSLCACNPDCSGTCGGSKTVDSCGICGGDGSACANAMKKSKGVAGGTVAAIVSTIVVLLIIIVVIVVVMVMMMRKKDQDTRRYVDSVVSSYLPMEDEEEEAGETTNAETVQATATL